MTLKRTLVISNTSLFGLLLLMGIVFFFGYRYVTDRASLANQLDKESMYLQMMLRGINEVIITEGTPASVSIAQQGLNGFSEIHSNLLNSLHDKDMIKTLTETVDPRWKTIKYDVQPFLEHHLDIEAEGVMIKYGNVIAETGELLEIVSGLSRKTRSVVNANSSKSAVIQKVIVFGVIIILAGFGYMSYRTYLRIMRQIRDLTSIAEGFHRGDLSVRMDESSKDEFGALAILFNRAVARLNSMISNVKSGTDTLVVNSTQLSDATAQIAANTEEQVSQTTQSATSMEEMNSSFLDVANNTSNAADSSKRATALAVEGGEVVTRTIEGMNRISHTVNESAVSIKALGTRSEQIGEIIKVINDIAGQTNLLALNAAIEAARAGEQGRGFAVVADEVRKLAERTTSATNEIADMIKGIQQDTHKAVESMHTGTEEVEEGVRLANQAGESLKHIVASVQNVTEMVQQVATAAEEQSSTGDLIASSLESVANLSHHTAQNAKKSSAATRNLRDLAQELQHLVSGFTLREDDESEIFSVPESHSLTGEMNTISDSEEAPQPAAV